MRMFGFFGCLTIITVFGCGGDPAGDRGDSKLVKLPSGLQYEDLTIGTGAEALKGKVIDCHYTGWLKNGKKFDSSAGKQPLHIRLGAGEVIKGWDEGIAGMKVGGKRKLLIPPDMAYGANGSPPAIPPYADLIFEVELIKVW